MADLEELIERVESGTGADRELDCLVAMLALGFTHDDQPEPYRQWIRTAPDGTRYAGSDEVMVRRFTTSLDAVLGLIEAKLPGWRIAEMKDGIAHDDGPYCHVRLWCPVNRSLGYKYPANATSPARALLAATLRALKETQHDR